VPQEGLPHGVSSLSSLVSWLCIETVPAFRYSVFAVFRVNEEAEDVNRSYSLAV
jgi:hypothetical protein